MHTTNQGYQNMEIDPFVSLFVYTAVATVIMTTAMFLTNDSDERFTGALAAMIWPLWVTVLLMLSPIWIGMGIFYATQVLKRNG